MRNLKFWLVNLTCLLALIGCGGGSTSSGPLSSCELPLKYADGFTGGYTIGATQTLTVPRQFGSCTLNTVQSASLSLCISHQQINELTAQLILPNNTVVPLNLSSAQTNGSTCLLTGKLFNFNLPASAFQSLPNIKGNWTVGITDTNQVSTTPVGYMVGWSFRVDGLQ